MMLSAVSNLWGKAWPVLVAILFFGIIIFIHELGHFLVAKWCGVKVNEFAIGMGPKLLKFGKKETKYSLRLFPFGGFCSMEGEDGESEDNRSFAKKPVYKKILIVCAGAFMNLVLGLVLVGILMTMQNLIGTTRIAKFADGAVSSGYGLREGDKLLKINGTQVISTSDISFLMMRDKDGVIDFTVERDGAKVEVPGVQFQTQTVDGRRVISYDFSIVGEKKTVGNVLKGAVLETASMARLVWLSLFDLVTGQFGLSDLAGPVGTVGVIADAASQSAKTALNLMAFITINIGVFNLLPIPALDGGRLLFLLIEGVRRKPINPKYEGYIHAAGLVILLIFMGVVTFNDILNLIRK